MYKKDAIKYIDELIFLSDFVAYNALGKDKKKIKSNLLNTEVQLWEIFML